MQDCAFPPPSRLAVSVLVLAATLLSAPPAGAVETDLTVWDRLLRTYVDDEGRVAYRDLAAKDLGALGQYLTFVADANVPAMSRDEALAFYINAYNACIFDAVLDGYTAETFFSRVRLFGLKKFVVGGERMNLDTLEKRVILARFEEPRVHFALVCASASCPKLARRAWRAGDLEGMLDERAREFLADRSRNPLGAGPRLRLSKIFDWYRGDFEAEAGSLSAWLQRYLGAEAPGCLARKDCVFEFEDYDWTLNAQEGQRP